MKAKFRFTSCGLSHWRYKTVIKYHREVILPLFCYSSGNGLCIVFHSALRHLLRYGKRVLHSAFRIDSRARGLDRSAENQADAHSTPEKLKPLYIEYPISESRIEFRISRNNADRYAMLCSLGYKKWSKYKTKRVSFYDPFAGDVTRSINSFSLRTISWNGLVYLS